MNVFLLAHTPEPEKVVAAAARCCYSNDDPDKLFDGLTTEKAREFIEKLGNLGHVSPLEHVSFTFAINGVSRVLLAQLTRHRIGVAFSVRSQRYNKFNGTYFMPETLINNKDLVDLYLDCMDGAGQDYDLMLKFGAQQEDARMILPGAALTSLVMTMNARELLHFFSLRCCSRASLEIQELAGKIVKLVKEAAPTLFKKACPSSEQLGYCPENKMSCGRKITLEKLLGGANDA